MPALTPRAASRFADIAPDAVGLIVRFLDFTMLARLCSCSIQLYSCLNSERAPLVWNSVRPKRRSTLLKWFTRASLADAQRLHAVYGGWLCQVDPADTTRFGLITNLYTRNWLSHMREWTFVYVVAMRHACLQGAVDKMTWIHSLYEPHVASMLNACHKVGKPLPKLDIVQELVLAAGISDRPDALQWVLRAYSLDLSDEASSFTLVALIVRLAIRNRCRTLMWLTTHVKPTTSDVAQALRTIPAALGIGNYDYETKKMHEAGDTPLIATLRKRYGLPPRA